MRFATLHARVVANLAHRVRNGETTVRRLASVTGISQPHLQNLLCGRRTLTTEIADRILENLDMSVLDLVEREEWERRRQR